MLTGVKYTPETETRGGRYGRREFPVSRDQMLSSSLIVSEREVDDEQDRDQPQQRMHLAALPRAVLTTTYVTKPARSRW